MHVTEALLAFLEVIVGDSFNSFMAISLIFQSPANGIEIIIYLKQFGASVRLIFMRQFEKNVIFMCDASLCLLCGFGTMGTTH